MSRASALLRLYREENPAARDLFAAQFGVRHPTDTGIQMAARMDMAMAIMMGFPVNFSDDFAQAAQKLHAYKKERLARVTEAIDLLGQDVPTGADKQIAFDYVPMVGPMAFVLHRKKDDSYAIGFDDGLRELFAILTMAALQSKRPDGCDLRVYDYYFEVAFRLYYWKVTDGLEPNADIVEALHDMSMSFTRMDGPLRGFVTDMRDRAIDFIMYHELGHIALGHFERFSAQNLGVFAQHPDDVAVFAGPHEGVEAEFEADAFAAAMLMKTARDDRERMTAWQAPVFALTVLKHLQARAGERTELARMMKACHPPTSERLNRIRSLCLKNSDAEYRRTNLILQIADAIDDYRPDPYTRLFEQ